MASATAEQTALTTADVLNRAADLIEPPSVTLIANGQTAMYRNDYRASGAEIGPVLVTVVRPLTDDECDPECMPMYWVTMPDGTSEAAFDDELANVSA